MPYGRWAGVRYGISITRRGWKFRIFLTRAEPLRNSEGRIVQWFGTNTDVNEQRLEEKARRETEKQLQVVMENMSEGLLLSRLYGSTAAPESGGHENA